MLRVRLSSGEFDMPDGATGRIIIQNAFLTKVAEIVPEVWPDLYQIARQTYAELKEDYPREYFSQDIERFAVPPMSRERISPVYARHPRLGDLIDLIDDWARKWNLVTSDPDDPWLIKVVLGHLEYWDATGREGEYLALGFGAFGPIPATPEPPQGLPPYNPLLTFRDEYLGAVREQALRAINDHPLLQHIGDSQKTASINSIVESAATATYCERAEKQFEDAGFIRGDKTRSLALHLDWAVRVQLKIDKQSRIAVDAQLAGRKATPAAVSKAVVKVLKDIGLR